MTHNLFIEKSIYKRSEIHDKYGGNRQGGISASAKFPYIFIFSGDAGHQHGYKDQWENSDVFSYTGEGQLNDMRFTKGNLALRDHLKSGKRVFLFLYVQKGYVRYESELELIDIDFFQGLDREGKNRQGIKFFFKRKGIILNYPSEELSFNVGEPPKQEQLKNTPNETERKGLVTSRIGQGAYFRGDGRCA